MISCSYQFYTYLRWLRLLLLTSSNDSNAMIRMCKCGWRATDICACIFCSDITAIVLVVYSVMIVQILTHTNTPKNMLIQHCTRHFALRTVKILSPSCLNQNPILRMYRVGWMRKCDDWRLLLTHEYIKNTEKTNSDQGRGHITKTSLRAQSKELYFMYERFKGKTNTSTNTWASFTAIAIAWLE